mgnify:CR=1 FL=1
MDYKKAGVDIEAGYKSVELMKEHVKKTMRPEVLGGLGGFSGAFSMEKFKDMEEKLTELRAEAARLMKGRITDRKLDRILEICAEIRKIRGEE